MLYTVGEVAKILNITPSTIRYYDKEGLLPAVARSGSGMRVFSDADLGWLRMIACLKHTGMPIKDIRRYVEQAVEGDSTINERLEILYAQRNRLQEQMRELQRTMDIVEYKCWYYETAKAAGTVQAVNEMTPDEIPEQHHAAIAFIHGSEK